MNSSCRGPDQAEVRRHLLPPPRQQEGSALPTTLGCFCGLRWNLALALSAPPLAWLCTRCQEAGAYGA